MPLASPTPSPRPWALSPSPSPWVDAAAALLSPALEGDDASALPTPVPPVLPPILALVCSIVAGLTSFGEAILYHVLWSLAAAVGILPAGRKDILTRAVTYLTIMPIANLPLFIYVARKEIKHCLVYGCVMAVTGMLMVPVGASLLYHSDVSRLKVGVGLFFLFFSVLKLSFGVAALGRAREDSIRFGKAWVGSLEEGDRVTLRDYSDGSDGVGSGGSDAPSDGSRAAAAPLELLDSEAAANSGPKDKSGSVGLDPSHPTWWVPEAAPVPGAVGPSAAGASAPQQLQRPAAADATTVPAPPALVPGQPRTVLAEFTVLSPAPELAALERRIDHGAVATDIALGNEPAPPPPPRPLPRILKDLGPTAVDKHTRRFSLSQEHRTHASALPGGAGAGAASTAATADTYQAQGSGPLPSGRLQDEAPPAPAAASAAAPQVTTEGGGVLTVVAVDAEGVAEIMQPPLPRRIPFLFRRHATLAAGYRRAMKAWAAFKRECCQPISPRFAVLPTLLVLLLTGSASGLLGGLFGTGGPPQMIAFAFLLLNKDDIRGVSVVYGCLELSVRVWAYSTQGDGRGGFDSDESAIYSAIAVASWIGFSIGTYLRRFADTDLIIRILLALVFVSSAILLGALDDGAVATAFASVTLVWGAMLALVYWRPPGIRSALDSLNDMRYTCSPRLSALFAPATETLRVGVRWVRIALAKRHPAAKAAAAAGMAATWAEPMPPIKRRASLVAAGAAEGATGAASDVGSTAAAAAALPATPSK